MHYTNYDLMTLHMQLQMKNKVIYGMVFRYSAVPRKLQLQFKYKSIVISEERFNIIRVFIKHKAKDLFA